MTYAIFYNSSDGHIFSYVQHNFEYDEEITGSPLINLPSKEHCASNNGVSVSVIGIKKWTVTNPDVDDFVININDFPTGEDLVEIE